jgi:CHAD domain-containing protein
MADGKWIPDLGPDLTPDEAARRVLRARLEVVAAYLPRAANEADRDPENVHQLRVSTRRAGAAVRIFRDCLPGKTHRDVRRRLRRIRRAAGATRDWDVFLLDLLERRGRPAARRPGLDVLEGYALGQRAAAQPALAEAGAEGEAGLTAFLSGVVEAVRPTPGGPASLGELARPLLAGLARELATTAAGDLSDYAHLHLVRIAGKRLRYAMEVFAGCFAPAFREELYPRVEAVQEILGRANDSHVAAGRLAALRDRLRAARPAEWRRLRPGVEEVLRFHQRRLPQERRRFLKWWERWRKQGAEELAAFLGGPAAGAG